MVTVRRHRRRTRNGRINVDKHERNIRRTKKEIWLSAKSYDEPDQYFEDLQAQEEDFRRLGLKPTLFIPISDWTGGKKQPSLYMRLKNADLNQIHKIMEGYVTVWTILRNKPSKNQLNYSVEKESNMNANRFLRGEKTESSFY